MYIRHATLSDLEQIAFVEAACFPPAEAASKESFRKRLEVYPEHFWLLCEDETIIGFVNGMVSRSADLTDAMYDEAHLHDGEGDWQMIFGVNTLPEYRCRGYAEKILNQVIFDAGQQGRKGLVLTCKERLIHYYAKFGFINEGISESVHGQAVWFQMRLTF